MAKGGVVAKDNIITHTQYLDLVYTQFGVLYDKILNALWAEQTVPPSSGKESNAIDNVIGYASQ